MTDSTWLNRDHQLIPGKEVFHSERRFHLLAYTASHGQLLMRSVGRPDEPGEPETTIDLLFKPAAVVKIRDDYRGLAIRCATAAESAQVKTDHASMSFSRDDRVFVLESQGESDYVVAMAVGWREGVLGRTQQSFLIRSAGKSVTPTNRPSPSCRKPRGKRPCARTGVSRTGTRSRN
ncbi:hypothetical protein ADL25_04865 [Streptomyces sp. NRRL F-5122]|uniref:hypothetical protein n=1 Tax=Streptomyces sp. NRRL F-5122 TaxID=1609098 RepID=UPI0007413F57|nr:hypothetical protein [Streptomyces sp. NRRL F-5122]KUJ56902.1 hypothetical protein ADL25_04865 [Streptomyces sp. NRRL F-5122]